MMIEAMFRRLTSRLILRPLARSDAEAVRQLYSDWEVAKWLSRVPWPFTCASAENFIADAEVDMEHGSGCHLAIETRDSATFAFPTCCCRLCLSVSCKSGDLGYPSEPLLTQSRIKLYIAWHT